jgi:aldose 1-epimerase
MPPVPPVRPVPHGPTGRQFALRHGAYTATVTETGATLRELGHEGRPLIAGFNEDEPMPDFNGALLAPWPNRIGDGKYAFDGREHQLPVSEPSRRTALHGLVAWQPWEPVSVAADAVELTTVLYPQRGYPFLLTLTARYVLGADGLSIEVAARNDGSSAAPYGVSMHPWFVADDEGIGAWTLTLPADDVLTVDDRLLPTGRVAVSGELDLRAGRALGATRLDHAFTGIGFEAGTAQVTLRNRAGRGVVIGFDERCRWVQVCTGDEAGPALNRRAVAIEPMTCPPDAFRSGTDVVRLEPGDEHSVRWTIGALH